MIDFSKMPWHMPNKHNAFLYPPKTTRDTEASRVKRRVRGGTLRSARTPLANPVVSPRTETERGLLPCVVAFFETHRERQRERERERERERGSYDGAPDQGLRGGVNASPPRGFVTGAGDAAG